MSTFCEIQSVHSVLNLKISLFDTFYVLCEIQSVHSVLGTLKISLFDTFYVLCKTGLTTGKASIFSSGGGGMFCSMRCSSAPNEVCPEDRPRFVATTPRFKAHSATHLHHCGRLWQIVHQLWLLVEVPAPAREGGRYT